MSSLRISAEQSLSEKDILMLLYTSCEGPSWQHSENWGSSKPLEEWFGVSVNADSGKVNSIVLRYNMLSGNLPPEIFELKELEVLNLSGNKIKDSTNGFHKLQLLRELNLSKNAISMALSKESVEKIISMRNSGSCVDFSQNAGLQLPNDLGPITAAQKVVDLSNCSLIGNIPDSLQALVTSSVEVLNLSNNSLSGSIPDFVGNMKSLKVLCLDSNKFSDALPESLGNLSKLVEFRISHNLLEGSIPQSISKIKGLKVLMANNCHLGGELAVQTIRLLSMLQMDPSKNVDLSNNTPGFTLPTNMDSLKDLEVMSLTKCSLRGSIPDSVGQLRGLTYLNLSQNNLGGELPLSVIALISHHKTEWPFVLRGNSKRAPGRDRPFCVGTVQGGFTLPSNLGELKTPDGDVLRALDLSHCSLIGGIPASISELTGLEIMNLSFNELSGAIPSSLCYIDTLTSIDFQSNLLEGPIPIGVGSLRCMRKVDLRSNRLSGVLPASLGGICVLEEIYVGGNRISGGIPDVLGNLSNIRILSLEGNLISGNIPFSLGGLMNLEVLNLAKNRLVGHIPSSFAKLINVHTIDLACNALSGTIPDVFNLSNLAVLDLSTNDLSEEVPESILKLADEKSDAVRIDLTFNFLEGEVPGIAGKQNTLNPMEDEDLIWVGKRGLETPVKKGVVQEVNCACEIFTA